jgi:hypothetical protein
MLAGGSPVSIYRSEDAGASWKRMPDPQLPGHAKMPFSCRVMRLASNPRRRSEIFAVLEVSGVMRSTDGGESWSDCSADLLRLAQAEPRLRSKLLSDTEAEGMLDGHAVCISGADPDSTIIAVRMGLFHSKDAGKTWQDMRVDRFSPFTYGRDIKVSRQDPSTLYACLRSACITATPGRSTSPRAMARYSALGMAAKAGLKYRCHRACSTSTRWPAARAICDSGLLAAHPLQVRAGRNQLQPLLVTMPDRELLHSRGSSPTRGAAPHVIRARRRALLHLEVREFSAEASISAVLRLKTLNLFLPLLPVHCNSLAVGKIS